MTSIHRSFSTHFGRTQADDLRNDQQKTQAFAKQVHEGGNNLLVTSGVGGAVGGLGLAAKDNPDVNIFEPYDYFGVSKFFKPKNSEVISNKNVDADLNQDHSTGEASSLTDGSEQPAKLVSFNPFSKDDGERVEKPEYIPEGGKVTISPDGHRIITADPNYQQGFHFENKDTDPISYHSFVKSVEGKLHEMLEQVQQTLNGSTNTVKDMFNNVADDLSNVKNLKKMVEEANIEKANVEQPHQTTPVALQEISHSAHPSPTLADRHNQLSEPLQKEYLALKTQLDDSNGNISESLKQKLLDFKHAVQPEQSGLSNSDSHAQLVSNKTVTTDPKSPLASTPKPAVENYVSDDANGTKIDFELDKDKHAQAVIVHGREYEIPEGKSITEADILKDPKSSPVTVEHGLFGETKVKIGETELQPEHALTFNDQDGNGLIESIKTNGYYFGLPKEESFDKALKHLRFDSVGHDKSLPYADDLGKITDLHAAGDVDHHVLHDFALNAADIAHDASPFVLIPSAIAGLLGLAAKAAGFGAQALSEEQKAKIAHLEAVG